MKNTTIEIAELLKELRKNENLNQIEFSNNVLSKSSYSRIESGEKTISIDELSGLLDKINITHTEFFYLLKSEKTTKQKWLDKSRDIFSGSKENILPFIHENLTIYNKNKDMFYFHLAIYGKILLNSASQKEITKIFNYLKNKNRYSYFDFRLLNNAIVVLKSEQVDILIDKMFNNLSGIDPDIKTDTKINSIFINLINFSIAAKEKETTNKYINYAKEHNNSYPDLFTQTNIKFLENLSKFRFEDDIKALQNCFTIIDWFNFMEYYDLANELKNDIKIYSKFKDKVVPKSEFKVVHIKNYN